ncbi:stage V sporulation protein AC [Clostridium gasigenes]|uniref:Stage V sporulation protein AC n=1 Tax=Clostridium gasigenes TaxID=94869 RepID=A0A1H0TVG8_9CLOT|nr:stage V sporulation protein AC [Clostridium gasigenes]MBB6624275.1 stage V sporulation protein AC [Clostridium gasigenes]MBU3089270.1 stage V sporulation protein AC [Clostridium gasigenes]MBU3105265.1 stage V sporulation protein AC [Clostridium gasigenes]MBU3109398.1 stage V sporulation protein AC [Clostridium gasigenes]MBU3132095.1 stage V sporulation protein AC [Clostridium gasigenes]
MANKEQKIVKKFESITKAAVPKPKIAKNCVLAFLVGGAICTIAQIFQFILVKYGSPEEEARGVVSIIMILLGALLTGVGIYDKIAAFGGAGTVVPITGFSNAIVSPAMEFKKEGFVFGVASKMFTIAGPVLVYGIGSSVIVGIIYFLIQRFMG